MPRHLGRDDGPGLVGEPEVGRGQDRTRGIGRGDRIAILSEIRETKKLSEDTENKLVGVVNDFKKGFQATDGSSVVADAQAEAMDEEDVEKESVKVRKPAPKKK